MPECLPSFLLLLLLLLFVVVFFFFFFFFFFFSSLSLSGLSRECSLGYRLLEGPSGLALFKKFYPTFRQRADAVVDDE
uniref:Uncharacterized protein n=2 Tax=Oryza sativa subsp. japonica TaxID=39947 RepID=Q7G7B2_ORYSJ|nr:hypothetical protein [Oryza sativa Japonica Group]AAP12906.1 hypothetical protein Os03g40300 [Oryza sativa Japonica Group]ABF97479.1 hypothetical protein LOC_Os03g40300 [Oryza sativa Japonica Group]